MYTLSSEDEKSFTIKGKDGKPFKVAKSALPKEYHDKVRRLAPKKMADGGEVDDEAIDSEIEQQGDGGAGAEDAQGASSNQPAIPFSLLANVPVSNESAPSTSDITKILNPNLRTPDQAGQPGVELASDRLPQINQDSQQQTQQQPQQQQQSPMGMYGAIANKEGELIGNNADIQSKSLQAQAATYANLQKQQDQALADHQAAVQQISQDHDALVKNIQDGKLDPNRFYKNQSTGSKISAAIGLMLGGISGALTGTGINPAQQILNKKIDEDLASQRFDFGKNEFLLQDNVRKYGSEQAGYTATKMNMLADAQARINQAALTSQSQTVKNAAQIQSLELQKQILPMQQQLALATMNHASLSGLVQSNSPEDKMLTQMNPKYAEKSVPVNGIVYQSRGDGKAANAQRIFESKLQPILDDVNELDKIGAYAASNPASKEALRAQSLRAGLGTAIAGLKSTEIGSTRINENEVNAALAQIKDPEKFTQMLNGGIKNSTFVNSLTNEAENIRKEQLIGYKGTANVPQKPF